MLSNSTDKSANGYSAAASVTCSASTSDTSIGSTINGTVNNSYEQQQALNVEYSNILLKVFNVSSIISELKEVLGLMRIRRLIVMLDDVSEIDNDALRLFIDTIVAPLNNWSDDFVKFKIAFYPGRVHYGKIDPGKIDTINLDFFNLYSAFEVNRMETSAIDFTNRLLNNRFGYFLKGKEWNQFFDEKLSAREIATLFFQTSMNVPRIIGYQLAYIYENVIIFDKRITKQDIENAAIRYYENNVAAFFEKSTYCLLPLEEKHSINQLIKIRDTIVNQAILIKKQITKGALSGKLYNKKAPCSSHFHVLSEYESYLESLELNHFISKYDEKSNKDAKKISIYCMNYGLARKNNISWGRPSGSEYTKYYVERAFNYTPLIVDQVRKTTVVKCMGTCGRVFTEDERNALEFTHYKCPDCGGNVEIITYIDEIAEKDYQKAYELPMLKKEEMKIILELNCSNYPLKARDLASELDMDSNTIATMCKNMDLEKELIKRAKEGATYNYSLTDKGKRYCKLKFKDDA